MKNIHLIVIVMMTYLSFIISKTSCSLIEFKPLEKQKEMEQPEPKRKQPVVFDEPMLTEGEWSEKSVEKDEDDLYKETITLSPKRARRPRPKEEIYPGETSYEEFEEVIKVE